MTIFKDYSNFYDVIYHDKNYKAEAGFVMKVIKKYGRKGKKILSLGCGTCTYEILMARKGFKVTGIDISKDMLNIASKKIDASELSTQIKLFEKDVRRFSFNEKFDNAMAMFNIAGYQTENKDFEKMLKNVSKSLKKGGVFVFDCWHMPAVLKDRPTDRIKKIKSKDGTLIRLTKSILKIDKNVIEINFDVIKTDNQNTIDEVVETHLMRYWSKPELEHFLDKAGFEIVKICNFMDLNSEISDTKWDIIVMARKK